MHKRKLMILAMAILFPPNFPLAAEETAQTPGSAVSIPAETIPDPEASAAAPPSSLEAVEARLRERDRQYMDLKKRAEALGVALPDTPPWRGPEARRQLQSDIDRHEAHHRQMMGMDRQEWEEARQSGYPGMRGERPETTPWERRRSPQDGEWARYRAVMEGMSDEERAACHAMQRRYMGNRGAMPEHPMMMPGPGMMGPASGYGPSPYAPGNFWDPNR